MEAYTLSTKDIDYWDVLVLDSYVFLENISSDMIEQYKNIYNKTVIEDCFFNSIEYNYDRAKDVVDKFIGGWYEGLKIHCSYNCLSFGYYVGVEI